MLIDIILIKVSKDRVRKDFGDIESLAKSIEKLGQLQPIVVNPEYELIAGERRFKAIQHLGYDQIDVKIMTFDDYLHMLEVEVAENEERKEFTISERVEYAKKVEELEALRARERKESGNNQHRVVENFPQGSTGKTRDIVAKKTGFGSGKQYEKAKFVVDNADDIIISKMDKGEISVNKAFNETKSSKGNENSKVTGKTEKQKVVEQITIDAITEEEQATEVVHSKQYDDFVTNIADSVQNLIEPFRNDLLAGAFQALRFQKHIEVGKLTTDQQHSIESVLDLSIFAFAIIDDAIKFAKLNINKVVADACIKYLHEVSVYEEVIELNYEYSKFKNQKNAELMKLIKQDNCEEETIIQTIKETKKCLVDFIHSGKVKAKQQSNNIGSTGTINANSYKILGVSDNATRDDAKKKYRALMLKVHPDHGGNDFLFQLVKEAYESIKSAK